MGNNVEVGYLTEDPTKEYIAAIKKAKTAKQLIKAIKPYENIADDAYNRALQLSDDGVRELHKGWKEMRGALSEKRATELNALWGDIIMPRKIMFATITADKFNAPWGTAYIRCEELGWPWEKRNN